MPKPEPFPGRLRRLRQERGLTQEQLAEAAGVPVRTLQDYEQDRREPTVGPAVRLAEALGVSLDALAGRAGRAGG